MAALARDGLDDVPVVVGSTIPPEDAARLKSAGIARVCTPKDFDLAVILEDLAGLLDVREAA